MAIAVMSVTVIPVMAALRSVARVGLSMVDLRVATAFVVDWIVVSTIVPACRLRRRPVRKSPRVRLDRCSKTSWGICAKPTVPKCPMRR